MNVICVVVASLFAVAWSGIASADDPVKFTEHLLQDGFGYAFGVAAADLDGDGRLDITASDAIKGELSGFINQGRGEFSRFFIKRGEPGWFERHAAGDIDGDGKPDVVVVKNQEGAGAVVWFRNPGNPVETRPWTRHVIAPDFSRAYDVCLTDLNGDGWPDVAASSFRGGCFAWFENPGRSHAPWRMHVIEENIGETRTIRAADFNGDGRPDLLGTSRTENLVVWYENPGLPSIQPWKRHVIDDVSLAPVQGHPIDIDGDGHPDVVMAFGLLDNAPGQIAWYKNVDRGAKWEKHVIGPFECAFEAVAGDLNGDGKPDVVATGFYPKGRIVWFENPGDPTGNWIKHVLKDPWPKANTVVLVDVDSDGRLDIFAAAEHGSNEVRWWRNEGKQR